MPKRLRYHLVRDPAVLNAALHNFLTAIERWLRQHSSAASSASCLGAVVFIHRLGELLNPHPHCHCLVVDGVSAGDAAGGGGFSVDAQLRIEAHECDCYASGNGAGIPLINAVMALVA